MPSRLDWHGEAAKKMLETGMESRLELASIKVRDYIRKKISLPQPPSAPGEYPHKDTGQLRRFVGYEVNGLVARVGTNVEYGKWLELGTSKMAARPWLLRSVFALRARIRTILGKEIKTVRGSS